MTRYARRVDTTQSAIVETLRMAGWMVWIIEEPCDLLLFNPATQTWRTMECKTANRKDGSYRARKDQKEQNGFCEMTGTPRVTSAKEALISIGYYQEQA